MKAYITSAGDKRAGIQPCEAVVELKGFEARKHLEPGYLGERQEVRDKLRTFFIDLFDEGCEVRFDDECPDCGSKDFREGTYCDNANCVGSVEAATDPDRQK